MSKASRREIYFSFFMFTADLKPDDWDYTQVLLKHLHALTGMGYDGFDLHIAAPAANVDHQLEIESYVRLKKAFDEAGLKGVKFATNVGATDIFDPTSPDEGQRQQALSYLKSRVDITSVLGGEGSIMSGPFLYPYGAFPLTTGGEGIWSDALLDWMKPRYLAARPVFEELTKYASAKGVKLAIEPVKNWEMPPPNMVSEVLDFLDGTDAAPCGVTFDTAQILMESQGPAVFKRNVARAVEKKRLHYVHISAPDRGEVRDCWIPWEAMLGEIAPFYHGPYLVEVFNAIPPFASSMRMTRRRFWRPGEDQAEPGLDSAYDVAKSSLGELRKQLATFDSAQPEPAEISTPAPLPGPIIDIRKVGEVRIHTFISAFTSDNIANATHIIESENALVLIDSQFLVPYATKFREYADSLGKPIDRLYLSHRHPDHWFGLGTAFGDVAIHALPETTDFIREHGEESRLDHLAKLGDLAPKTIVVPQHVARPGVETIDGIKYVFSEVKNTEIDFLLAIRLPELKVCIPQDLIYSGTHLYLTKDIENWIRVLETMLTSGDELFLPGHGLLADKHEVGANIEYLAAAKQALESGLTNEAFKSYLLQRYPARLCPGIFDIYLPRLFDGASQF